MLLNLTSTLDSLQSISHRPIKSQQVFCRSSKYLQESFQQKLARTVLATTRKKVSAGILPFQQIFARTFPANTCQNSFRKHQKESFSRNFAVLAKTSQNCSSKTCQNRSSKNLPELSIQYNPAAGYLRPGVKLKTQKNSSSPIRQAQIPKV